MIGHLIDFQRMACTKDGTRVMASHQAEIVSFSANASKRNPVMTVEWAYPRTGVRVEFSLDTGDGDEFARSWRVDPEYLEQVREFVKASQSMRYIVRKKKSWRETLPRVRRRRPAPVDPRQESLL